MSQLWTIFTVTPVSLVSQVSWRLYKSRIEIIERLLAVLEVDSDNPGYVRFLHCPVFVLLVSSSTDCTPRGRARGNNNGGGGVRILN